MPCIRSGLGDRIDDAARMQAVPRRQSAGLHAKLRKRIGEGKWHVDVGKAIVVVSAIEQVVRGIARAARNGDGLRTEEALTAGVGSIAVIDGRAGDRNELRGIPPIERQVNDPLLIHHLGNRILLRLHHGGTGVHLYPFRHRPDLHGDVDLDRIVDSQKNAALYVRLKSWNRRFQFLRANRQAWNGVNAVRVSHRVVDRSRIDSDHLDLGAGYQCALLVDNTARHRGNRNGLGKQCRRP